MELYNLSFFRKMQEESRAQLLEKFSSDDISFCNNTQELINYYENKFFNFYTELDYVEMIFIDPNFEGFNKDNYFQLPDHENVYFISKYEIDNIFDFEKGIYDTSKINAEIDNIIKEVKLSIEFFDNLKDEIIILKLNELFTDEDD